MGEVTPGLTPRLGGSGRQKQGGFWSEGQQGRPAGERLRAGGYAQSCGCCRGGGRWEGAGGHEASSRRSKAPAAWLGLKDTFLQAAGSRGGRGAGAASPPRGPGARRCWRPSGASEVLGEPAAPVCVCAHVCVHAGVCARVVSPKAPVCTGVCVHTCRCF